jgi:tryptophan-rich sensory protein
MECLIVGLFELAPARNGKSLGLYVAAAILVTLALNGLVFALGWAGASAEAARPNSLLPLGWVIGGVWLVILTLVAGAAWWLASDRRAEVRRLAPWALALIGFCLAYPFYTIGFRSDAVALFGNLATIIASAFLAGRALASSRGSAALILLPALWTSFATYATIFGR